MNDIAEVRYCEDLEGNRVVSQQMAVVVQRIRQIAGPEAIILGGSYGRGEGVVRRTEDGRICGVNDYDICCVWDEIPGVLSRQLLKRLTRTLPLEFGIRHVDIMSTTRAQLHKIPPTLMAIDLTYGGIFLFGDQSVLDGVQWQPNEVVARSEILNLLLNRMVTLTEGHPLLGDDLSAQQKARQVAKVMWAIIDSRSNAHSRYRTHYKDKFTTMQELSQSDTVLREIYGHAGWLDQAWSGAITEVFARDSLPSAWEFARRLLVAEIADCMSRSGGDAAGGLDGLFAVWRGEARRSKGRVTGVIQRAQQIFGRCSKSDVERVLYAALVAYPNRESFPLLRLTVPEGGSVPWRMFLANLIDDWYDSFLP